jgi:UDP-glucose 4-epimerase
MARYVVTGGAGFIGSHLVDALLGDGHAVRVLDDLSTGRREHLDPRAELLQGDVADAALLRHAVADAEGCFHLAAIASVARGHEDWLGSHRNNLTGTIAVLDAAREFGRNPARNAASLPVVYASSAAVYGDQGPGAIAEPATPRPISAYGADKLGGELHARVAWNVHGVPTLGLRFFNVYGPRQTASSPYGGVLPIFAARIAAGRPITIHGDGQQVRDFIYVADVVRHLRAGMDRLRQRPEAAVFNACSGRPTSVLALAQMIAAAIGRAARVGFGPARPGDIRSSLGNPLRTRAELGVVAETALPDGLARTLAQLSAGTMSLVA